MSKGVKISKEDLKIFEQTESLKMFISTIRKYDALSTEDELALFKQYRENGDEKAREQIFLHNQRFVFSVAKKYAISADELVDYVNEGNFGLNEAIEKFDYTLGYKFCTFMVNYVRRQMYKYMMDINPIIRKTNKMKFAPVISDITERFFVENGRKPSAEEIRDIMTDMGITVKSILDIIDMNVTSIDASANSDDDDFTVMETNDFNEATASRNLYDVECDTEESKTTLDSVLSVISDNEQTIIKKMYGVGYDHEYSMEELADEYHMSIENMEKLTKKILAYLQQEAKAN